MVCIHPFRALRYSREAVPELSDVLAPPYDLIDAAQQEQLYQTSPYNIVRLILGKQQPTDTDVENQYTRARGAFEAWCDQGILRQDPRPAFYVIEHEFQDGNDRRVRLGFSGLLQLDGELDRAVYRHERTFAGPKADRTKLLEAVPANLSPILCVYPGGAVPGILRDVIHREPSIAQANLGTQALRVWAMTDPSLHQEIARHLASTAVMIADGHHRFEVAWAKRTRYPALMCHFVSMEDPALILRPIHRVARHAGRQIEATLRQVGTMEKVGDLRALMQWLSADGGAGRFGYYDGHTLYTIRLGARAVDRWLADSAMSPALATLDVSILHGLLLPHLGIAGNGLQYVVGDAEAVKTVDRTPGYGAGLLRGIALQQIYDLAVSQQVLPQKSTYFYPKALSGLTLNLLQDRVV